LCDYVGLWRALALVAGIVNVMGAGASGAIVEYDYQGIITSVGAASGIAPGTRFSGTFAYDTDVKNPAISIEGTNQYFSGVSDSFPGSKADSSGLSLTVGDQHVYSSQGGLEIGVNEIEYAGQYGLDSSPMTRLTFSNGNVSNPSLAVSLELSNPTSAVLHSLALPSRVSLADFSQAQLLVVGNPGSAQSQTLYMGTIESLRESTVPEPALATLLGVAAAGWMARRNSRPRSAKPQVGSDENALLQV